MARVSYAYHTCIRVWVCLRMAYVYTRGAGIGMRMLAYYGYVRMDDGLAVGGVCRMGMFGVSPTGRGRSPRDTPNIPIRGVSHQHTRMISYPYFSY